MIEQPKIFVAGHRGMVGSAIIRHLQRQGHENFILRNRSELDLTDQAAVRAFFAAEKPDQVYLAAAKVGGIHANHAYPAAFISENLMIETNVIDAAFRSGVKKLLLLGSSCIYPKLAPQPIREEALLDGLLEPTNEFYAIAKIAGIKLCESYSRQYGASHGVDYRVIMPCNLYGSGDNYHPENAHVIPALIRRFHEAKQAQAISVSIWGSGTPRREFLHVDDVASACVEVMNLDGDRYRAFGVSHINVGSGHDITIAELAALIARVVGFEGAITADREKLDGTPRKLLDSTRLLQIGWRAAINLETGLRLAYADFLQSHSTESGRA